jgi:uncharacterized protein YdhG (YjbR/CyaY superfamily)
MKCYEIPTTNPVVILDRSPVRGRSPILSTSPQHASPTRAKATKIHPVGTQPSVHSASTFRGRSASPPKKKKRSGLHTMLWDAIRGQKSRSKKSPSPQPISSPPDESFQPSYLGQSGYPQQLGQSGYSQQLGQSGFYPQQLGQSGYSQQLGQSGYSQQLGQSGYSQQLGQSGYSQQLGQSGYSQQLGQSGFYPQQLGQSGYSQQLGQSGYSQKKSTKPPHKSPTTGGSIHYHNTYYS